ncbi:hypothetical protein NMY22_g3655 [Coprinellus aureogranulatus]|nr:hypothetical protein NMY22_g3655 [Coprinellus aureogranulatus]
MSTSSSKDATKSAKKARTAQAGQRVGSRSKQKTKKRLPSLHEMPFDIFLEILLQVDPKGLINLARTNKDTRRALVNSNMDKLLWKRIREDSEALDPPPGWSEAKWIGFLFVTFCQSCGKGNATIDFFILKRLCIPCKKSGCVEDETFCSTVGKGLMEVSYMNPESIRKGRDEEDYFYYWSDVNKTLAEWKSLCANVKTGVPNALSELQIFGRSKLIMLNAGPMMRWEAALQERRKQNLSSNKENLVAGIRQRFAKLGLYKTEDIYNAINMKTTGICGSASSEVTDRTWKTWRAKLEPSVTEVRDARIRSIRSQRMSKIISQWSAWKESLPLPTIELLAYPQSRDLWYHPEVTAIREMAPEVVVEDGFYQSIVDDFPNIASKFISSKRDKLRAKVPRLDNPTKAHSQDPLELATSVFTAPKGRDVRSCGHGTLSIADHAVIGWKALSLALCTTIDSPTKPDIPTPGQKSALPTFNHGLSRAASSLVRLCGLDPATTTKDEMDGANERFICSTCAREPLTHADDPSVNLSAAIASSVEPSPMIFDVYDWKDALAHARTCGDNRSELEKLVRPGALDQHIPSFRKLGDLRIPGLRELVDADEEADRNNSLFARFSSDWYCNHCLKCQGHGQDAIYEHLRDVHKIQDPVMDTDCFTDPVSPHRFIGPSTISVTLRI